MATPENVLGLLEEDVNCFVATASYGSPLHEKVITFKQFRDQFLIKSALGRRFIYFYYKQGPKLAQFISKSESLKAISRAILWPAWGVAWLSLKIGVMNAIFLLSTLFLFPLLGLKVFRNIKQQRTNN